MCSQAHSRCCAPDHVHTEVLWLMDPAAWAWVGDGSTYKFLIPSPVHGEEVGFFIISQYCSCLCEFSYCLVSVIETETMIPFFPLIK